MDEECLQNVVEKDFSSYNDRAGAVIYRQDVGKLEGLYELPVTDINDFDPRMNFLTGLVEELKRLNEGGKFFFKVRHLMPETQTYGNSYVLVSFGGVGDQDVDAEGIIKKIIEYGRKHKQEPMLHRCKGSDEKDQIIR
ncbi:hypothetical protein KY345_01205 [Candidatus Woesearchaeota archaeon]|nr:hypothetical protein [Candidatus Woesearchaeota archaeon]